MDRIIIREQDNTSNVESLSSYDVVYVPGFSTSPSAENYRVPVLITNKYDFVNIFGDSVPRFSEEQSYFLEGASGSTPLFPEAAIPNYNVDYSWIELQTNTFPDVTGVNGTYYTRVQSEITTDDVYEGITYYGLKQAESSVVLETLTGTAAAIVDTVNDILSEEDDNYISAFSSTWNPSNNSEGNWYVLSGTNTYTLATDTFINNAANNPTTYFTREEGPSPMFSAGDADPGYRYALALLSRGMPVYYEQMNRTEADINIQSMYSGLVARFVGDPNADTSFDSMGDYSVKYITSGGYPTFEYTQANLAEAMISMASKRKDSIALIDHTDNPDRPLTSNDADSIINAVRNTSYLDSVESYGAMFTPWFECSDPSISYYAESDETTIINNKMMPGSFAYLSALAGQIQNYNPWLAVSGVTRGRVPYCEKLHTTKPLTNNIADSYQVLPSDTISGAKISINPITYIRNYGYCIWGNRTLKNNASGTQATSFLNVRSTVCDIKKRLFEASQRLLFEQNTDILWLNFRALITPLLDTMKSDYILSDYNITRLFVDPKTGKNVPAYEVMAVIRIQPINSIEIFDLTIYLENSDEFNIETSEE